MGDKLAPPDMEAAQKLTTEMWVLLGVVTMTTILRTMARIRNSSFKKLQLDDYLVWLGLICFTVEGALAYILGTQAHGLANNGMSDSHREALLVDSDEHRLRVKGSMIHLGGWSVYSVSLWALKASWLAFYLRLTEGLKRSYRTRIHIGFLMIIVTWIAGILNLFLSCRPFKRYWQIYPNPGNVCQPAVSNNIVWVWYAFNVSTDLYLLSIPLPMLWGTRLGKWKKFGLMFLFSGGIFVVICATLRAALIVTTPVDGTMIAGAWGIRETFVAITTANLPHVFAIFKAWFGPWLGIQLTKTSSSRKPTDRASEANQASSRRSWRDRGASSTNSILTFNHHEGEERTSYIRLNDIEASSMNKSLTTTETEPAPKALPK